MAMPLYIYMTNSPFTINHTTADGQAIATASRHDLTTTPFLAFHNHRAKPRSVSIPADFLSRLRMAPGTGSESTINPMTDFSFAFAAAVQSEVDNMRGIVTRRGWPKVMSSGLREGKSSPDKPSPVVDGVERKYEGGSSTLAFERL